jgi:RNA polymerase sigma factor (sigma-70 family)
MAALEDLVQDTLIVIWRRLHTYEGRGPLEAWAYRIASYELLSALRASRRLPVTGSEFEQVYAVPAPAPEPEPSNENNHFGNRLMRHLRGREAQIVRLKHFEDLSFEEIAKLLEVAPSTAKTHYYRAVEKLRTILAPLAGEVGA